MTTCSRWIRVTAALGLGLFLYGDHAVAIQDSEDKVWFGPVGITPGERALVNIHAIGNPNENTPWDFVVRVFDRRGTLIQQRRLQLAAGVIGSVELAIQDEEDGIPRLGRRTFRAEIVGFNPQPDPPGKWAATLEIVDRLTARTTLVIGTPEILRAESLAPPGAAQ